MLNAEEWRCHNHSSFVWRVTLGRGQGGWLQASTLPDLSSVTARFTSFVTLELQASVCTVSGSSLGIYLYLSSIERGHTVKQYVVARKSFSLSFHSNFHFTTF